MQVEAWADLIVEIANRQDLETNDKRLRVDTLKWLMSKIAPKNYGDRLLVAGETENPVRVMHQHIDSVSPGQLDALERLAAALLVEQR